MVLSKIYDNRDSASLASQLRAKRLARFAKLLAEVDGPQISILDIGGTIDYWENNAGALDEGRPIRIDCVNLPPVEDKTLVVGAVEVRLTEGDATNLADIETGQYDLAHSNSVIEHVGNLNCQIRMAEEVRRVARGYFVQTPYRYFPIEPHFLVPGWQFLPISLRGLLLSKRSFGWMPKTEGYLRAKAECEQIRLLTSGEMKRLFPDATMATERFALMCKSLMAIKSPKG